MANQSEQAERSSFRDPAGQVFRADGVVYRRVFEAGRDHYESLMQSGLYKELAEAGLIIPHEEVVPEKVGIEAKGAAYLLKPEPVPFISYPYEWAFSAFQDAALLTLEVQRRALQRGLILKDASAYNVQFVEGRPVLIDTLSFEPYTGQRAWQAYGQFCRHFLAPLVLMCRVDVRLGGLMREYIDGIPLDLAAQILPFRRQLRPGLLLHLAVHSKSQLRYANKPVQVSQASETQSKMAKQSLLGLAESLSRTIRGLKLSRRLNTEWGEYYTFTNYSQDAAGRKAGLVTDLVKQASPQMVWDLGGNDGRFSRAALAGGAKQALCFDVDPVAVEKNYRQMKRQHETNQLPLLLDLTNPSPALGWAGAERASIEARTQPGTLVMALALIHHLAISNNLPFELIAEWMAKLGDHLIIEFVPKDDSKVQTLLATRKDIFEQYTQEQFEVAFTHHFEIMETRPVEGSQRTLYLMKALRHG
jgi:hypothetical protein